MNKDLKKYIDEFENQNALQLFFKLLKEMISELHLDADNENLALNLRNDVNSIHATLNSRLVFGINKNANFIFMANTDDLQVLSSKMSFIKQEKFIKLLPKADLLYIDYDQFSDNIKLIKPLWLKSCKEYEPAQEKSQYREHHLNELYQIVMNQSNKHPFTLLISDYKVLIKKNGLNDELYKWELIRKLQGRPNLETLDFASEIKQLYPQQNNLVFHLAGATSIRMAKFQTEPYRLCLKNLFDETVNLETRINEFLNQSNKIYDATEGKNSAHHDERTLSAYLTFKYPENYTFYKSSYYEECCDLLGIKPKEAGLKYAHYLSLIKLLTNDFILNDTELLNFIDNQLNNSKFFRDANRNILAQDILYQMLDKTKYWVFQANPMYFKIEKALQANAVKTWRVNQNKNDIKIGDKVILWVTGDNAGIYALATVCSNVKKLSDTPEEVGFYTDKSDAENIEEDGVELIIDYNLVDNIVSKSEILSHPILKKLKQGVQGTNLKATRSQYQTILELIKAPNEPEKHNSEENIMKQSLNQILFGPPGTGKTYNTINKAIGIVNPNFDLEQDRKQVKLEFERLVNEGQIMFCTFHQSMSYEDFIEGIKP